MKYGLLNEEQIKKAAERKLDKLISIWHSELTGRFGYDAEIVLGNRRDSASPVRGGVLTSAVIEIKEQKHRLKIWYDPLEIYYEHRINQAGYSGDVITEITEMLKDDRDPGAEYDPVANPGKLEINSIAVQIGRWLLKIRGYLKLGNENRNYYELETFLNSECGIPALYQLFNEAGFDYSSVENKRLVEVYEGLGNMDEPTRRVDIALNALRISNIFEFSEDSETKNDLKALLDGKFKRISEFKNQIDDLKAGYNLADQKDIISFMKKLVLQYRLPGSWVSVDETTGIF